MKCNFATARTKNGAVERKQWRRKAVSLLITARWSRRKKQRTASDSRVFPLFNSSCCPSFSLWSWQQTEPSFPQLWHSKECNGAVTGFLTPARSTFGKSCNQKLLCLLPKLSFITTALQLCFHFVLFFPWSHESYTLICTVMQLCHIISPQQVVMVSYRSETTELK